MGIQFQKNVTVHLSEAKMLISLLRALQIITAPLENIFYNRMKYLCWEKAVTLKGINRENMLFDTYWCSYDIHQQE